MHFRAERREAERWGLRAEILARMRLKRNDTKGSRRLRSDVARAIDDSAMAAMDPIEIAKGENRAARLCRPGRHMAKDLHDSDLRTAKGRCDQAPLLHCPDSRPHQTAKSTTEIARGTQDVLSSILGVRERATATDAAASQVLGAA
jgi:hypothetical protein